MVLGLSIGIALVILGILRLLMITLRTDTADSPPPTVSP